MRVRAAQADGAATLADIYRPYVEATAVSFENTAPDGPEMAGRMLASPRLPWLVAEADAGHVAGHVAGYAYATRHRSRAAHRWAVDCSGYLMPGERGRGTGRLLYSVRLPTLRELGYRRAYAGIALPNATSVRLHEALGFTRIGVYKDVGYKLGSWHDVGWWELPLTPARTEQSPEEPKPWAAQTQRRPADEPGSKA